MSTFNSNFKFTPIHSRYNNDFSNQKIMLNNSNFNNRLINNFEDCFKYNRSNYFQKQNTFENNNPYFKDNYPNNSKGNDDLYNSCYIVITNFDKYLKGLLYNFFGQQGISSKDFKNVGNDKIIIKFQNQIYRNEFMNNYHKIKDNLYGVRIQYIDENEKEKIMNNNANRVIHNISYINNYMDNDYNLAQLPPNKSNFQKFLDVFLNL